MVIEPTISQRILGGLRRIAGRPVTCSSDADTLRDSVDPRHGSKIKCVAMPQRYIDAGEALMREERAKQDRKIT